MTRDSEGNSMLDQDLHGQSPYVQGVTPPEGFVELPLSTIDTPFGAVFRRAAEQFGEREAVRGPGGQLTFTDVDRISDEIAVDLARRMPTTTEVPVGVWMDHDIWIVPVLIGIVKAGAMALPIDPLTPPANAAAILADAGAPLLLVDATHTSEPDTPLGTADTIDWTQLQGTPVPDGWELADVDPDAGFMLFYTSGTTGGPKGVDYTHKTFLHAVWLLFNGMVMGPYDRLGVIRPISNAPGTAFALATLLTGAVVCTYDVRSAGLPGLPTWLRDEKITVFPLVPSLVRALGAGNAEARFESLRLMMISGERVDPSDIEIGRRLSAPDALILTLLGSTETTVATWFFFAPDTPVGSRVPIGYPVPGKAISVLDTEGKPVPPGDVGELTVTSEYLARGYWRRPDLTARAFRPAPDGGMAYRTGDLARVRPDGALEVAGRRDSQVKIRGHRVELGAVEAALLDIEGITEAVVVLREGRGGPSLTGFYVLDPEADVAQEDIRQTLDDTLDAQAVPSVLVGLGALPTLPNGKVDRRALPEVDVRLPRTAVTSLVEPIDELEQELLGVWEMVLGISPVSVEDDLLELCDGSLGLTSFVAAAEDALGLRIPFSAFVDATTIRELAAYVREQQASEDRSSLVAIQPHGSRPPIVIPPDLVGSTFRYRLLVDTLGPDQPLYGFESPYNDGRRHPYTTVETLAGLYLQDLKAKWPSGPYHIAGWSFGTFVALEMACQLVQAGEEVGLLALIDTGPTLVSAPDDESLRDILEPPRAPLGRLPGGDRTRDRSLRSLARRGQDRAKAVLTRLIPESTLDHMIWSYDLRRYGRVRPGRRLPYVWATHRAAAALFHWPAYDGDALYITMQEEDDPDLTFGLDRLVQGELTIRYVIADCRRHDLMTVPWVDLVGTELRRAMDERST